MQIHRRRFALYLAGSATAVSAGLAAFKSTRAPKNGIWERRVYRADSVLPPVNILLRHNIRPVSVKPAQNGTAYIIPFVSTAARARAWDGFNADEEWQAVRDAGRVAVQEIRIAPIL